MFLEIWLLFSWKNISSGEHRIYTASWNSVISTGLCKGKSAELLRIVSDHLKPAMVGLYMYVVQILPQTAAFVRNKLLILMEEFPIHHKHQVTKFLSFFSLEDNGHLLLSLTKCTKFNGNDSVQMLPSPAEMMFLNTSQSPYFAHSKWAFWSKHIVYIA